MHYNLNKNIKNINQIYLNIDSEITTEHRKLKWHLFRVFQQLKAHLCAPTVQQTVGRKKINFFG